MKKLIFVLIVAVIGYQFFMGKQVAAPDLPQQLSLEPYAISSGNLVLVNRDIQLKQDPTNLAPIPADIAENVIVNSEFLLENQAIKPLKLLFDAATNDRIEHFIINSAYRSGKLQQQLYEKHGADYALPSGYSEHQTGLSLDIGSTAGKMENVDEGKWLEEHAADFGFILRYPEDKVDVTGINYEPWHFRYVGLPHSLIMKKQNFVLEEYITFLKKEQFFTTEVNDTTYFIQYTDNETTVNIPDTANYRVSGDNESGFIITSIIE
ncbi:M15 family metallopeptidase [Solibacillus merdavium]|uniref:M15 family metallopeptidase n=1 Tax=Solibacillus merdavium TaxID=2762218 RepID=A0ABR8XM11_9BACL|nr:M15 family metallopeptidase [Solibacillus merdavium]MBD8032976.1 M15 family metallopeptidase [Solibacillus merdavium]